MERSYTARNGVEEVTRFVVPLSAKPRAGKANASTPRKAEANKNQAAHILGRLLNNNFEQGDLLISPGYSAKAKRELERRARTALGGGRIRKEILEDAILAEVDKDAGLFIRRCRAAGAKNLRYVIVPSDRNGKTGKPAAPHVHIVLSGEDCSVENKVLTLCGRSLTEMWGHAASVEYEFLRGGSYNRLAVYLLAQTRDIPNRKRYRCSRNLEKIVPVEREISASAPEEIQPPAGAEIQERQINEENPYHMQYVRYILPKRRTATRNKRKETEP